MQAAIRPVVGARASVAANRLVSRPITAMRPRRAGRTVSVQAAKEFDLDTLLMDAANKFEKAENKTAIIGYSLAAGTAILTAEWLIHLPGLNVLLGFPIQLLGLLLLPYLGIKYFVKGQDATQDVEGVLKTITDELPGLGKK